MRYINIAHPEQVVSFEALVMGLEPWPELILS
jgi:hypothetical protein